MKTYKEYIDDLNESRNYTHGIGKTTAILRKWLSAYSLEYKIHNNEKSGDFQLYIYNNGNFTQRKFNIIITMAENMGYFPSTINIDDRDLFLDYKEYCNFKNIISNDKKDIDYINFLKSLTFDDFNEIYFQFECYQDSDIKEEDLPKQLYHVCRTSDVDDILKNGFIPKSKSKISFHPNRVYFSTTLKGAESIIDQFKDMEDVDYTVLKLNIDEGMKNYLKLKKDPNFDDGYYTNQNISPYYISK